MKKMNKRRSSLWLAAALLLLLPYQNCAQNFKAVEGATTLSSSQGNGNETPAPGGNGDGNDDPSMPSVPTTTMPVTANPPVMPCLASEVGAPTMVPSQTTSLQALSGKGDNAGRKVSGTIAIQYTASNAPSHCQQTVQIQCARVSSDVTALNTAGARTAIANNDISCLTTGNRTPGSTISISFRPNDNDSDKQCLQGTATYRISLQSVADTTKVSSSQTVTVNFKNNCYPEQITAEALDSFDQVGTSVAVDGSTAAVVAPGDDGDNNQTQTIGAIYIYKKASDGNWNKSQVLRTDDTSIVSDRGVAGDTPASIALKNNVLVVGSEFNNSNAGAVYIFKASNGTFALSRKIAGNVAGGRFGRGVAVDASQIAVGAPGESSGKGAVYIFDANTYAESARIISPLAANAYFGASLAIDGSLLAVGAPASTLYRDTMTGELLIYKKTTGWAEVASNPLRANVTKTNISVKDVTAKTVNLTIAMGSELGSSVAIFNGAIIVGLPGQMTAAKKTGLAIVISQDLTSLQTLSDTSGGEGRFGASVGLSSAGAFVGAPELRGRGGAVDHFVISAGAYKFERRISSYKSADNDQFGFSVAASGSNFVVGAKLNAEPNNASGSASFMTTVVP